MGGFYFRPSKNNENEIKPAFIDNASFERAIFIDKDKKHRTSCVNFNDATFSGSASFDGATFDGVPKFHNASMHSETSFRDLGKIPDIDGKDVNDSALYSFYQSAFRTLRQHMETNNSSALAFEFGRREMIAKQRRREYIDVSKSEIFFTKMYGKLADYGQNFIRPIALLLLAWPLSLLVQFMVIAVTSSTCWRLSDNCAIDWNLTGEAFERGTVFALPPFTMLINRSIDSEKMVKVSWFADFLSGGIMIIHAVTASLLLFLFALGIKRKMQIR